MEAGSFDYSTDNYLSDISCDIPWWRTQNIYSLTATHYLFLISIYQIQSFKFTPLFKYRWPRKCMPFGFATNVWEDIWIISPTRSNFKFHRLLYFQKTFRFWLRIMTLLVFQKDTVKQENFFCITWMRSGFSYYLFLDKWIPDCVKRAIPTELNRTP